MGGIHKQKYTKGTLGFTIVELIIVVVVIAIIATLTIVIYSNIQSSAKEKVALSELQTAYDKLLLYSAQNGGTVAQSLSEASISQPSGAELAYYHYDNDTQYCISARTATGVAFYRLSGISSSSKSGGCDEPDWIAGTPLAFNDTPGTNKPLSTPISGTPDITLYTVFTIVDASQAWSGFGGLNPGYDYNRFYFQGSSSGSTTAGYRIDTPAQLNATGGQASVRTPGYHIGWMQTTSSGTSRSFAYDKTASHATATLAVHAGWSFTDLYNPSVSSTYSGIATIVYDAAHNETTRQEIMNWLSQMYGDSQLY